jgi:hypothetical protein
MTRRGEWKTRPDDCAVEGFRTDDRLTRNATGFDPAGPRLRRRQRGRRCHRDCDRARAALQAARAPRHQIALPSESELDSVNYAPRVRVPTLILNGRCDCGVPVNTAQRPLFAARTVGRALTADEWSAATPCRSTMWPRDPCHGPRYLGPVIDAAHGTISRRDDNAPSVTARRIQVNHAAAANRTRKL